MPCVGPMRRRRATWCPRRSRWPGDGSTTCRRARRPFPGSSRPRARCSRTTGARPRAGCARRSSGRAPGPPTTPRTSSARHRSSRRSTPWRNATGRRWRSSRGTGWRRAKPRSSPDARRATFSVRLHRARKRLTALPGRGRPTAPPGDGGTRMSDDLFERLRTVDPATEERIVQEARALGTTPGRIAESEPSNVRRFPKAARRQATLVAVAAVVVVAIALPLTLLRSLGDGRGPTPGDEPGHWMTVGTLAGSSRARGHLRAVEHARGGSIRDRHRGPRSVRIERASLPAAPTPAGRMSSSVPAVTRSSIRRRAAATTSPVARSKGHPIGDYEQIGPSPGERRLRADRPR